MATFRINIISNIQKTDKRFVTNLLASELIFKRTNQPFSVYKTHNNRKYMIENNICVISNAYHIMTYSFSGRQYIIYNLPNWPNMHAIEQ